MSETPMGKKHTLMLDNRRKLVLTGAVDVNGFIGKNNRGNAYYQGQRSAHRQA